MASIPIYRQDYGSSEFAGVAPNTFIGVSAVTLTSGSASANLNTIGLDSTYGEPEFKDHKTLFVFKNTSGAEQTVTFHAGDTYAARDKVVTLPSGECAIWLDSSKFANNKTGVIKVETSVASIAAYGVEMR